METDVRESSATARRRNVSSPVAEPGPVLYDRSSMPAQFMVEIPGQTEDDFFQFAPPSKFCELIDGVVYMPSPVENQHQLITLFLYDLIHRHCEDRDGGVVLTGPAVLKLRNGRLVEPDIFVMPPDSVERIKKDHSLGPAALVIEVLSPSNRAHDLVLKSRLYRNDGIPEIWFVDHHDEVLIVERNEGGRYRKIHLESGRLDSLGVPGFGIELDWLWEQPLPKTSACYRKSSRGPKRSR